MANKQKNCNTDDQTGTVKVLQILGLNPKSYDLLAPFSVEKIVTPNQAKQILAGHNTKNRPLSSPHVSLLQRDMTLDRWSDEIGEAIFFDTEGVLVDGQHRLAALSKSKKQIKFVFKFNRPDIYRHKVDQGRPRQTRDTLDMDPDILHGTHIPAIYKGALLGQALDFENKADWDACKCQHTKNIKLSPGDAKEVYLKYQNAFDFVTRLFHEPGTFYSKSGAVRGVFLRAYLHNPKLKSCLEKVVNYLSENDRSDLNLALLASDFKGKYMSENCKTVKGKIAIYGLTEKLIKLFSQDTSKWKVKPKLTPAKDELFPFPAFDRRKPGDTVFISGKERRRNAKIARDKENYDEYDDFDLVA